VYSMTGFGRATYEEADFRLWVEVKSYNSKNLDIYIQLPSELNQYEQALRLAHGKYFSRGKFDVRVGLSAAIPNIQLESSTVTSLAKLASQLQSSGIALQVSLRDLQQMGLLTSLEQQQYERPLFSTLITALEALRAFRKKEGSHHQEAITTDLATMQEAISLIESRQELVADQMQERLHEALASYNILSSANEQRFLEEVSYLLIKGSIKEEIVRFHSHLHAAGQLLQSSQPVGRSLDFIAQELQREVNTIASKCEDMMIKNATIRIKGAIDSVREQARNIE
jgi:uncharacterized protein (TIGR00255 family)